MWPNPARAAGEGSPEGCHLASHCEPHPGFKADKIGTMLAHIRRWKVDDIRKQQSRARSTIPDLEVLEELSEMVDLTTAEPWIARNEGESTTSSSKHQHVHQSKKEHREGH